MYGGAYSFKPAFKNSADIGWAFDFFACLVTHTQDPQCMVMDETLYKVSEKVKNFSMIWLVDLSEVPDFTKVPYDFCHFDFIGAESRIALTDVRVVRSMYHHVFLQKQAYHDRCVPYLLTLYETYSSLTDWTVYRNRSWDR